MKKNMDEFLGSEITVTGKDDVLASGCRAIISYSCEEVCLNLCDMILHVRGQELTMKSYYGSAVRVTGRIERLDFEN